MHLGCDVARCAYILSLPHFKISFSFNEADFPFRAQFRADPVPFRLFESGREGVPACCERGSMVCSIIRTSGNPADRRLADAQGTLGFGIGPCRVSGQDPSGCRTSPVPGGSGFDSRQTPPVE